VLRARVGTQFEASGCNLDHFVASWPHPLVGAVHHAFAGHYPLVLSPDDVWLCIAQGFAAHVDLHAEALRDRFVRHQGRAEIEIRRDEFRKGSTDNDWPGCFAEFSDRIADHIGKKRDLIVADFSTTGAVERAASEVVLMASMKHYFDYSVRSMCGIPRVTLLGTVDDWRSIERRAGVLAEFDLEWWTSKLAPLLAEFVAAASGRPNAQLWRSLYKPGDHSGGPYTKGWINVLFPYLDAETFDATTRTIRREPRRNEFLETWSTGFEARHGGGPCTSDFPLGLSIAPFTWKYFDEKIPMELVAGFVGVSQDPATLAVRPAIGWAVRGAVGAEPPVRA
jgi:hypothetical protein